MALSTNDAMVAMMQLGPNLLHDENPEFVTMGRSEYCPLVQSWKIIINNDLNWGTILGHPNSIDTFLHNLILYEEASNSMGTLSSA